MNNYNQLLPIIFAFLFLTPHFSFVWARYSVGPVEFNNGQECISALNDAYSAAKVCFTTDTYFSLLIKCYLNFVMHQYFEGADKNVILRFSKGDYEFSKLVHAFMDNKHLQVHESLITMWEQR